MTSSLVVLATSDPPAVEEPSDGLGPYWIETAVVLASGVTDPAIVAAVPETEMVEPVLATGNDDPAERARRTAVGEPQRSVGTRENRVAVPVARRVDAAGDLGDLTRGCDLGNRRWRHRVHRGLRDPHRDPQAPTSHPEPPVSPRSHRDQPTREEGSFATDRRC